MSVIDFLVCLVVAAAASVALYLGYLSVALFGSMFFLLIVVNITLFHMQHPQPRYMVGADIEWEPEEETEEE